MKAILTVLTGVGVWAAAAISAGVYIHALLGTTILLALVFYMAGALSSAWSFFGYPASLGGMYR